MGSESLIGLRRLTQYLFLSGGLNILLLTVVFYLSFREKPPTPYCESKPASAKEQQLPLALDRSTIEVIRKYRTMSFEKLAVQLANPQQVENGFSRRDLALAALTAFKHFDLQRALGALPLPMMSRKVAYGKRPNGDSAELIVYPGLSDAQYEAIRRFIQTERWPLTAKGLFLQIKNQQKKEEASLVDAFFQTSEFMAVKRLLNSRAENISNQEVASMLAQGDWTMLSSFHQQQRIRQDLSTARRQKFLIDYVDVNSSMAADLLLRSDGVFALEKLDDKHVLQVLQLLDKSSVEGKAFAKALLQSPRKDVVLEAAAAYLKNLPTSQIPLQVGQLLPQQS